MTTQSIADLLKQLRKTSTYSANEVVEQLKQYNIEISAKTLYGYESGISMLNADVFIALCKIYKCDNPMDIFGTVSLSQKEQEMIEKYRYIAQHSTGGAQIVDSVIDHEYTVAQDIESYLAQISDLEPFSPAPIRLVRYYQNLASAGSGEVVFDDGPDERIEIPDIPEYRRVAYAITVNGHSMEPDYSDGDTLLVEVARQIDRGEVGIFIIGDKAFVKKLGETELISLNEGYANIPLTEDTKCMGRVVGKL